MGRMGGGIGGLYWRVGTLAVQGFVVDLARYSGGTEFVDRVSGTIHPVAFAARRGNRKPIVFKRGLMACNGANYGPFQLCRSSGHICEKYMKQLMLAAATGSEPVTMTSREIAELTGKNHAHVMRDIRALQEQLGEMFKGSIQTWIHPQNGQTYDEYLLDKDTTLTLMLGYDAVARMKVVKRWQELEAAQIENEPSMGQVNPAPKQTCLRDLPDTLARAISVGVTSKAEAYELFRAATLAMFRGADVIMAANHPQRNAVTSAEVKPVTPVQTDLQPFNQPLATKLIAKAQAFRMSGDPLVPSSHLLGIVYPNESAPTVLFDHGLVVRGYRLSKPGSERETYRAVLSPLGRVLGEQSGRSAPKWYLRSTLNYLRSVGVHWSDGTLNAYLSASEQLRRNQVK